MSRTALAIALALVSVAISAHAQSPYVAGTIGADVSRSSHAESNVSPTASSDSEVISGSLRVGTSVGQNWGVELEFVRSGRSRSQPPVSILPLPAGVLPPNMPSPIGVFQTDVRRNHSDFDAVAWARQRVSGSVDLVYLGGIAFSRERIEITQTFPTVIRLLVPGGVFRTTSVTYGTRPLVGAEARIALTSHVRLLPGLRIQGQAGGWLLRPYAGLGWFF